MPVTGRPGGVVGYRQGVRSDRRHRNRPLPGIVLVGMLLGALLGACTGPTASAPPGSGSPVPGSTPAGPPPVIFGTATAGPVCPVEPASPDPSCAPRPVSGAVIVITDTASGTEVARVSTGPDGSYSVVLPRTGTFVVTGLPKKGLLGTPAPVTITLSVPGQRERIDLAWDTGIR